MKKNLTCTQVLSLINYYIEGKLNPAMRKIIDLHIENCPKCKNTLSEIYKNIAAKQTKHTDLEKKNADSNTNKTIIKNLSAYIDNELNTNENIKIKKITVANPAVRKKLESMYKFRELLHSSYEKTKNEIKTDYSKSIIASLTHTNEYTTTYFKKLIILFVIIMVLIISGFIYLYF